MKVTYYHDYRICFENSNGERFEAIDVIKRNNLNSEDSCWRLIGYRNGIVDGEDSFDLEVMATVHENGEYASIMFGYHTNKLVRRELWLNPDGYLQSDVIFLFNPQNSLEYDYYKADIDGQVKLDDYIGSEHVFRNGNGVFNNVILQDDVLKKFMFDDKFFRGHLKDVVQKDPEKGYVKILEY